MLGLRAVQQCARRGRAAPHLSMSCCDKATAFFELASTSSMFMNMHFKSDASMMSHFRSCPVHECAQLPAKCLRGSSARDNSPRSEPPGRGAHSAPPPPPPPHHRPAAPCQPHHCRHRRHHRFGLAAIGRAAVLCAHTPASNRTGLTNLSMYSSILEKYTDSYARVSTSLRATQNGNNVAYTHTHTQPHSNVVRWTQRGG